MIVRTLRGLLFGLPGVSSNVIVEKKSYEFLV